MGNIEHYFYLTVDGKEHGPYPSGDRPKYKHLFHLRGVSVRQVWIEPPPVPAKAVKVKKDKSTPLLEGTGWVPVKKR